MAAPPPRLLLTQNDVPGAPGWVAPMLERLNAFSSPTADALTHGLTFTQNHAAQFTTVTVTTPDDWVALPLLNSWTMFNAPSGKPSVAGAPQFGSTLAVRMGEDWMCHLHGAIGRATAPSSNMAITQVPKAYLPAADEDHRRPVEMGGQVGAVEILPSGALNWLFGGYGLVDVSGVFYRAATGPPRWAKPLDIALVDNGRPLPSTPTHVLALSAMQANGLYAPVAPLSVDWTATTMKQGSRTVPGLRINRIAGLRPKTTYNVTMLVLAEGA